MVRREADRARVVGDRVQQKRFCVFDQDAKNAAPPRQCTDCGMQLGVDAGRQETLELVAGLVDDAERRIAGAGQSGSRLDQLLQQGIEGLLRAERDAGVDEAAEALSFGRLGHSGIISARLRELRSCHRDTLP